VAEPHSLELAMWSGTPPDLVEAFRGTMDSLLFSNSCLPPRIANGNSSKPAVSAIVVTSPEVGDGKTTVSTNLAIALARIGRRVVLVDGDMRQPRLHKIFGVRTTNGLSDLLTNGHAVEDQPLATLVQHTRVDNLFVLPTAVAKEDISGKLHSPQLRALLRRLWKDFDLVIIDSPPMLCASDARVLGWLSDGVLLVLRAGKTTRGIAAAAQDCLMQDGIRILGTVLNDWKKQSGFDYGAYSSH
jgi:succinoglycan biosynthesis transport protein ExoP